MGFVDRGGGREAKGSSLRRSRKNPGAPSTKNKSSLKNYVTPATRVTPTPAAALLPLLSQLAVQAGNDSAAVVAAASAEKPLDGTPAVIAEARALMQAAFGHDAPAPMVDLDAAVALLSRRLDADGEAVFRRASEEGRLAAILCWCSELERQPLLMETCRTHNKLALQQQQQQQKAWTAAAAAAGAESSKRSVRFATDADAGADAAAAHVRRSGPIHSGDVALYCLTGIHANSVDRASRKVQEQWIEELSKQAKSPEVLGILSGLNLSRESGTHFAQEWAMKECWRVAGALRLPLVLHLHAARSHKEEGSAPANSASPTPAEASGGGAVEVDAAALRTVDRAAEILQELLSAPAHTAPAPVAVVLYDGLKALSISAAMRALVRQHRPADALRDHLGLSHSAGGEASAQRPHVPFFVLATAEGLDSPAESAASVAYSSLLPTLRATAKQRAGDDEDDADEDARPVALSQLLVGTDSPWGTPQNIPDAHLRTLPNEPGNYGYVVQAVHDAMVAAAPQGGPVVTVRDVANVALRNALWAFFSDYLREAVVKLASAGAEPREKIANDGVDGSSSENEENQDADAGKDDEEDDEDDKESGGGGACRFASRKAMQTVSATPASAVATAYVCEECRATLFYPRSLLTHQRRRDGAASASGGASEPRHHHNRKDDDDNDNDNDDDDNDDDNNNNVRRRRNDRTHKSAKKDAKSSKRGARASAAGAADAETEEGGEERRGKYAEGGAVCPSPSALFLLAETDSAARLTGVCGAYHGDALVVTASRSNARVAAVSCARCEAKLGDAQFGSTCYDCGAALPGAVVRLRPRAVEECPVRVEDGELAQNGANTEPSTDGARAGRHADRASGPAAEPPREASELELLLAAAAREREQLERERVAGEEAAAAAHQESNEDARRRKEKKKNVKANNRSNFTHFRNKDFAPRVGREKKSSGQRPVEGANGDEHNDNSSSDDDAKSNSSSNSSNVDLASQSASKPTHGDNSDRVAGEHARADSHELPAHAEVDPSAQASRRLRKKANKRRQQQQQQQQQAPGGSEESDDEDR